MSVEMNQEILKALTLKTMPHKHIGVPVVSCLLTILTLLAVRSGNAESDNALGNAKNNAIGYSIANQERANDALRRTIASRRQLADQYRSRISPIGPENAEAVRVAIDRAYSRTQYLKDLVEIQNILRRELGAMAAEIDAYRSALLLSPGTR